MDGHLRFFVEKESDQVQFKSSYQRKKSKERKDKSASVSLRKLERPELIKLFGFLFDLKKVSLSLPEQYLIRKSFGKVVGLGQYHVIKVLFHRPSFFCCLILILLLI